IAAGLMFASIALTCSASAIRTITGFTNQTFARNDDDVLTGVGIGFGANFFGNTYTTLSLSNNGNVQFNGNDGTFTPYNLTGPTGNPIIAPFFADVDTRDSGEVPNGGNPTMYGTGTLGGHNAFAANWINVGDYNELPIFNTFQLVLIDRSDTGAGNFDFEFNYTKINWEAGTASGSDNQGLGGTSARAGYNSGTGNFYELPGSGVNGAFLDNNLASGLIHNQFGTPFDNANLNGRYDFSVRNGGVVNVNPVPEPSTYGILGTVLLGGIAMFRRRRRAALSV
ncbi:MAG: nidogen-like domain-containing protein, partial [Opitutaceae bacterium]